MLSFTVCGYSSDRNLIGGVSPAPTGEDIYPLIINSQTSVITFVA